MTTKEALEAAKARDKARELRYRAEELLVSAVHGQAHKFIGESQANLEEVVDACLIMARWLMLHAPLPDVVEED